MNGHLDRYLALCMRCKTSLMTDTPPESWYSCPICYGATLKLTISIPGSLLKGKIEGNYAVYK